MSTLARANEIVSMLEAASVRATTDPYAANAPCVLVTPPNMDFDLGCGVTATWQLIALAPAAATADRTSWATLDNLVLQVSQVVDLTEATLVSYVVNGRTYPAYILHMSEALTL
jgi:pyrroline-5-carboxylate reductase